MRSMREILRSWAALLFAARDEKHYARRASTHLLSLYRQHRRAHPDLAPRALYAGIVAQRLGVPADRAVEIVRRAEESFADWPAERALMFRDVVHYVVFEEYTHTGRAHEGTRTNMGLEVAHVVPDDL